MTSDENPYASPAAIDEPVVIIRPDDVLVRRGMALTILATAVISAVVFVIFNQYYKYIFQEGFVLLGGGIVFSVLSAVLTRDRLIAPLTCFLAVMSGDMVVAMIVSWVYAQAGLCALLALLASLPACVVACLSRYIMQRRYAWSAAQAPS
ncbi:MAG: hypothetical protein AAFP90_00940 [Planctomycetota bacterium]